MKKIKLAASISILSMSLNVNAANMGAWVSNSTIKAENKSAPNDGSQKILNAFFGGSNSTAAVQSTTQQKNIKAAQAENKQPVQFAERPESQLIANQRQELKNLTETQEDLTPTPQLLGSTLNQDADNSQQSNTETIRSKTKTLAEVSESEILVEQKRMENFIFKAQQFIGPDMINSLTADQSIAINLLNSALMQVGVEEMSGMSSSGNQTAYNKAVGCVNSFSSAGLNGAANTLISKYMSVVNIASVVNVGPQVGGSFKAKCY